MFALTRVLRIRSHTRNRKRDSFFSVCIVRFQKNFRRGQVYLPFMVFSLPFSFTTSILRCVLFLCLVNLTLALHTNLPFFPKYSLSPKYFDFLSTNCFSAVLGIRWLVNYVRYILTQYYRSVVCIYI